MGDECSVCETVKTDNKNQLKPLEESQLPRKMAPDVEDARNDDECGGGFIMKENSKYYEGNEIQDETANANAPPHSATIDSDGKEINQKPEKR